MRSPILGSAYSIPETIAAANRMVNLFPEIITEGGKDAAFLRRAPGLVTRATAGSGTIRGMRRVGAYLYVVSGTSLYRVDTSWTVSSSLGTVSGTGPVSLSDNGTQIFIAAGATGYIYNTNTFVFAQITDPDFPGATTVGFLDGYFVFNEPNTGRLWVTSLYDGTSVDPLDFATAEGAPDNIVSLIVDHREVWLFGSDSIEVWYDSGGADFPLARIQGAFIELGCAAAFSVARLDNGVFWLGSNAQGTGIVYRADGYSGKRISTHAIEAAIASYGDVSDAIAYSYQQGGHSFYVLTFPTAEATWVYDVATDAWHERARFESSAFGRHRSNCVASFNNQIIVGDYQNGKLYALDLDTYADAGVEQKWLRSWRALSAGQDDLKRKVNHRLQLDCQTGVGLVSGTGSNPQVMLRWSDDGGQTWSNEHWRTMGGNNVTHQRVIWRRLGMTLKIRDRVFEVSGTDPVKVIILGADMDVEKTRA